LSTNYQGFYISSDVKSKRPRCDNEPNDGIGFGRFPGQYGMAVFSRFETAVDDIATMKDYLWSKRSLSYYFKSNKKTVTSPIELATANKCLSN
jgi:hypothetical protein